MGLLAVSGTAHIIAGVAIAAASQIAGVNLVPFGVLFALIGCVQKIIAAWQWMTQTD